MSNFKIDDLVYHEMFGKGRVDCLNMSGPIIKFNGPEYESVMCVPEYALTKRLPETIDELTKDQKDEVCDICKDIFFNGHVNTGPHNLCEGAKCEEAFEMYIEELEEL